MEDNKRYYYWFYTADEEVDELIETLDRLPLLASGIALIGDCVSGQEVTKLVDLTCGIKTDLR